MGLFDSLCCESGLIVEGDQQLIVIVEASKDKWVPIAAPIAGSNDRGGTMDIPSKLTPNMKALRAFGRTLEYGDDDVNAKKLDLEGVLNEIRADGSGATWNERPVSFALIDAPIYKAIVKAVAANGATAWTRYARLGLALPDPPLPNRQKTKAKPPKIDATTKRLCEAILASPNDDGPRKVYLDHLLERDDPRGKLLSILPVIRKLRGDALAAIVMPESIYTDERPSLVELAQFMAWGTTLVPAHGEGQFTNYEPDDDGTTDGAVAPYVERAKQKYAGMPELLAAVAVNEKAFRQRWDDDD